VYLIILLLKEEEGGEHCKSMVDKAIKPSQVRKAIDALLTFIGKQNDASTNLLEEEDFIYLVIALKKVPETRRKDKPIPLPLPNPIYNVQDTEICLFVKDHKGEGHAESKSKVKAEKIPGIAKVLGVSKLKSKYESHEKKRQLCNSYDLFLADDRILPSLPKLIGKTFFKKKKQPIPVKLSGKDWAKEVRKACNCTFMHLTGSSMTIRVAKASQTPDECVENVVDVITKASGKIPGSFKEIKSLYLKSVDSVALPIYQSDASSS